MPVERSEVAQTEEASPAILTVSAGSLTGDSPLPRRLVVAPCCDSAARHAGRRSKQSSLKNVVKESEPPFARRDRAAVSDRVRTCRPVTSRRLGRALEEILNSARSALWL